MFKLFSILLLCFSFSVYAEENSASQKSQKQNDGELVIIIVLCDEPAYIFYQEKRGQSAPLIPKNHPVPKELKDKIDSAFKSPDARRLIIQLDIGVRT